MSLQFHQNGQGIASFLIAAVFLLVPISLGLNYLAKIGDARHKTHEATRYALWERTAWYAGGSKGNTKTDGEINNEIGFRIFGRADIPIDSMLDKRGGSKSVTLDPNLYLWATKAPRPAVVIEFPAKNLSEIKIQNNTAAGGFAEEIGTAVNLLSLDRKGFFTAEVNLNLRKADLLKKELSAILPRGGDISISNRSTMLVGAWNADKPSMVKASVDGALLTDRFDIPAFETFKSAISVFHPEIKKFNPGLIEPEIIPCQRLNRGDRLCK